MAIGYLTSNWAMAEHTINIIIQKIYEDFDGSQIDEHMPRLFKRKRKYILSAYSKNPNLKNHIEEAKRLMDSSLKIANERHDLVHGISINELNNKSGIYEIINFKRKSKLIPQSKKITIKQIIDLSQDCMVLNFELLFFGAETVRVMPKENLDNYVRGIFEKDGVTLPITKLPS